MLILIAFFFLQIQFTSGTHFSLVRIIESLQQLNTSAFSTATSSNQSNGLPSLNFQVQTFENLEKNTSYFDKFD